MAMAVSFGIRSYIEGGVITFVILLNVVVGFFQEYSAEKTMDSLRSLSSPTASLIRAGDSVVVPSGEVVPGDVLELKTGDTVPADIRCVCVCVFILAIIKLTLYSRLIEAVNFETDEALLTGESLPVRKSVNATFDSTTGPGDRLNVAYSSSLVTKGRAKGIVFATGTHTEIGAIASELSKKESRLRPVKHKPNKKPKPHRYLEAYTLSLTDAIGRFLGVNVGTPLQRKLSKLAVLLFGIAVVCAIIVLGTNGFSSEQEVIIYAVATGLSMIPASLVVVLTITMAAGTKRMVKRHVIVRNLKSLEALGAVTDICSDKTGTLTQGKMLARAAWIPGFGTLTIESSSAPTDPTVGDILFDERAPNKMKSDSSKGENGSSGNGQLQAVADLLQRSAHNLEAFLNVASLANLATVSEKDGQWHARGDPTEIAMQVFASRFNWNRLRLTGDEGDWSEIAELPFDSEVKRMSVVMKQRSSGEYAVYTKGAVERLLRTCTAYTPRDAEADGTTTEMTDNFRQEIIRNMEALAGMGLRVLALASKPYVSDKPAKGAELDRASVESALVFRGLIGLYDPPRPESAAAVRECHAAGISVHMLTGDHPETAKAIAVEVGILPKRVEATVRHAVMTAADFDALDDDEVDELSVLPLVIARCAPSTKVRMIEALHRRNKFCAMVTMYTFL